MIQPRTPEGPELCILSEWACLLVMLTSFPLSGCRQPHPQHFLLASKGAAPLGMLAFTASLPNCPTLQVGREPTTCVFCYGGQVLQCRASQRPSPIVGLRLSDLLKVTQESVAEQGCATQPSPALNHLFSPCAQSF